MNEDGPDPHPLGSALGGFLGAAWLREGDFRTNVRDSAYGLGFLWLTIIAIAVVITVIQAVWRYLEVGIGVVALSWLLINAWKGFRGPTGGA